MAAEEARGWPDAVPRIAADGWARFAERAPADVLASVDELRHDIDPLVRAVRRTPLTFLHGDWKLGNLGVAPGRTVLLDWTYPGDRPGRPRPGVVPVAQPGPPPGVEGGRRSTRCAARSRRRGIDTDGWWEPQVELCLLGALVQFGWEKALGDDDELGWWCDRAREGARRL